MVLTLEDMGFEIEASHHEVAPAQHEIDFRYDEALKTADNIMTFKLAVKRLQTAWTVCKFYAKAKTGNQRFRYACEYVPVERRQNILKTRTENLD